MKGPLKINLVVASAFVTVMVCAACMYKISNENNSSVRRMHVEGQAEREVNADVADWSMFFEHTGEKRSVLRKEIDTEKREVIKILVDKGIPEKDIEFYNYIKENHNRVHRKDENAGHNYRMGYCVRVKTKEVALVTKLKNNLFEIFDRDLKIVKNSLKLNCSKQDEIELALYKDAIKNALSKANNVLKSLDLKVDKIITIENPMFTTESLYQEHNVARYADTNSPVAQASFVPDANGSHVMQRRKIKGMINLTVSLK